MSWLRLDALTFQDRSVRRAGRSGRLVFLAAVTMTKAHLWISPNEERGYLPSKDFNAEEIAVWFGEVGDDAVAFYEQGIAACLREGLIESRDGGFIVPNWRRYQPDPTTAERTARYEKKQREKAHSEKREKARQAPPRAPAQEPHCRDRDSRGRDGTGRDEVNVPVPLRSSPLVAPAPGAAAASAPGGSGAAPSGIAVLSPEQNHARLTALAASIGGSIPTQRISPAEFEARRAAALSALNGDPSCHDPASNGSPSPTPTKTNSDAAPPRSSTASTSTDQPAANGT